MANKKYFIKEGQRFGRLTVVNEFYIPNSKGYKNRFARCICDCGNKITPRVTSLFDDNTKSCGCLREDNYKIISKTHGKSKTPLYFIFICMKNRCYRKEVPEYKNYGNRGIKICKKWLNDFMSFYNWAINNGYKKGLTIERKDNDKGYSPENCEFVTRQIQCNNKRDNHIIKYNNEQLTMMNFCRKYNLNYGLFESRIRNGKSIKNSMINCGEYKFRDQRRKKILC